MKKHILYCNPADGKLNWQKPFDVKNLPWKLQKYGRVKVTFEKYVQKKSMKQLGYYHAGILPFLEKQFYEDMGLTKDDWHAVLKEKFGIRKESINGEFSVPKSHRDYTEKEMAFFLTQVKDWAFHYLMIQIPPPTAIEEYL